MAFPKFLHWGGSLDTAPKSVPAGGMSMIKLDGGRSVMAHNEAQEKAYRDAGYGDENASPDYPKALHAPHSTAENPVQVHAVSPEHDAELKAAGHSEELAPPVEKPAPTDSNAALAASMNRLSDTLDRVIQQGPPPVEPSPALIDEVKPE